jgi:hypothetical protein
MGWMQHNQQFSLLNISNKTESLKNWRGRDEGEDPEKDGKKKLKEISKCWE